MKSWNELTSVFSKYECRRVKVAGWTVVLVSYSRGRQRADYDNLRWDAKVLNHPSFLNILLGKWEIVLENTCTHQYLA